MTTRRAFAQLTIAAVLVVIAAGCSSQGSQESSSQQPAASDSASADSNTGDGMSETIDWEPTIEITPLAMTEEEKVAFRARWLDQMAEKAGVANDVELVRWTSRGMDDATAQATCLEEHGFAAEADPVEGGVAFPMGVPESQSDALNLAIYSCAAQYSLDPIYLQEWTDDQLFLIWDYWEQAFIPCLEAEGIVVNRTNQPSKEAWMAAFHTPERISWWPQETMMALPEERYEEVSQICSPYPANEVFYGTVDE